ncbi:HAD family hydrolase [Nocardiopsis suaedae]|uniref:HAD family phosphatase n=1 Tax=Nocardiopsis suaedae TaxID=3018444 RepID=A0ABT4TLC4_9ACTN|nr:HAD family phosphatase [Nocardiopsis suaedae]MDA2805502.1 HAD family phosphatase [Nocardiopsis suaedae]
MAFAAVVFDMDGVLVESEHLWEENWTAYAARHGVEWSPEDTAACQGKSAPEWAAYLAEACGVPEGAAEAEKAVVDGLVAAVAEGRAPLLEGAAAMVRDAAARVPVALASSAARPVIDAALSAHGLADAFTATVSSAEVARGKPSPDVYQEAAARLGRTGAECLGVEDSSNGIRAAAAAGLTVIAVPNPAYPPKPDALELAAEVADGAVAARGLLLARLDGERETEGARR